MSRDRNAGESLALLCALNVPVVIGAVMLANFIFIKWQAIPMEYYSYNTLYRYYLSYGQDAKISRIIWQSTGLGGAFWLFVNVLMCIGLFAAPKRETHGSARFANLGDVRRTGLLPTPKEQAKKAAQTPSHPSILVGKFKGKFLEFFGNEFAFVAAPTRSGKGVGIVIPNLLHYRDSVVVLDVKNENWDITAGFRSQYQDCYLFAPKAEDGKSHRYNPLDYIDRSPLRRMGDIQNIANIIYPADGQDAFWQNAAQRLFTGIVLYMLETPARPCAMSELVKLATPNKPLNEWITDIIEERKTAAITIYYTSDGIEIPYQEDKSGLVAKDEVRPLSVECIEALMSFAGNASDNTRAGILSSLSAPLNIFTDPMVAAATGASDFRLDEVRKRRMSIFVGIQPNELPRFDKLLNLFFSQLINLNTKVLPEADDALKYQCLVLLDEFTALGRVEIVQKSVAYIAGYNMRLMLIFQNKGQAEHYYTKEGTQTLLSNMACQIVFAPREQSDAEEYSRLLGNETIKSRSISRNQGKGGGGSTSTSEQSRALLLPQELRELDKSKEIILYDTDKPILADKIKYYEEAIFKTRTRLPIKDSCVPPALDLQAMLDVMRGVIKKAPQSIKELPTDKDTLQSPEFVAFFDALGIAVDEPDIFDFNEEDN